MEPEDIVALPPLAQGVIDGMRHAIRQKWTEAAMTFFARAIVNKDVAVACGEAGFSEAMVYHRNKSSMVISAGVGIPS